jgi:phosphatidylglycerol:prolipoprotein diacylglycerol transferase
MNYYGGLAGAIVAALIYGRAKKIDILDWGDMLVAGIPLGYTFGRIGNFINGELYGRVTTAPWGMIFPHAQRFEASEEWVQDVAAQAGLPITADAGLVNLPRHPTQLYEAFAEGIVMWLIMWLILRKHRPYRGYLIGMYVIFYGAFRFIIDYFRMPLRGDFAVTLSPPPNPPYLLQSPFNFIASQFYSLLMVAAGVLCLIVFSRMALRRVTQAEDESKKRNMRKLRKQIRRR